MTRDDVLRLARAAGCYCHHGDFNMGCSYEFQPDDLSRFTALVMEECARQCDQMAKRSERDLYGSVRCAAAIRDRKP